MVDLRVLKKKLEKKKLVIIETYFNDERLDVQTVQYFKDYPEALNIRYHRVILASNVKILESGEK